MECEPDAEAEPLLAFERVAAGGECTRFFRWRTHSACRQCVPADYHEQAERDCKDGQQQVDMVLAADAACNGPRILSTDSRPCEAGYSVPVAGLVIAGIAFAGLVAVIVFVFMRNRSLSTKYQHLASSAGGAGQQPDVPQAFDVEGGGDPAASPSSRDDSFGEL